MIELEEKAALGIVAERASSGPAGCPRQIKQTTTLLLLVIAACAPPTPPPPDDRLPYATTPPPGGQCGRDWSTFDTRRVYLAARRAIDEQHDAYARSCVVLGFDDVQAVARGFNCNTTAAVIGADGRIMTDVDDARLPRFFVADVGDDGVGADGLCRVVDDTNDVPLPVPACADDWVFSNEAAIRPLPLGGYAYSCASGVWHHSDGREQLIAGEVVAFNEAKDALVFSNDDPPSRWHVVRSDGERVAVTGLPEMMRPSEALRTTRVDGLSFIVVAVEGRPVYERMTVRRFVIDDDGTARETGTFDADRKVLWGTGRFDVDGAFIALAGNERYPTVPTRVVRVSPDGSPVEDIFTPADDVDRISIGGLISGP